MENSKLRLKLKENALPAICHKFSEFDSEFDVYSGRAVIDGKDLTGFYSIDTSKPIEVRCILNKNETIQKIMNSLMEFIEKEEVKN